MNSTEKMDIFTEITFDSNYEWSSGEDEEKEKNHDTSVQTSRCAYMTSADLDKLEQSKNEANTIRQTAWALNCFQTWLSLKDINVDFKSITKTELNTVLRQFYGSIRTTKGELYSISSYLGLRAGLNRYINEPPVSRSWNLMQDPEFTPANNVFKGVLKEIRRAGKVGTHYPPISPEDQRVLKYSASLNPDNPKGLLNKVWYDIQLHFGRRGKEGNRVLKPDSFVLKRDKNGAHYFTMAFKEETKNHKDSLERDRDSQRGAMFEERGNPLCPVASLKKYLMKIPPGAKAFYLQPRREVAATDTFWYTTTPLGVNQLSQMLPKICREAGTHTTYTNHSLRATAMQKLSEVGLEAGSGHRSESSLKSYWTPTAESGRRWISIPSDQVANSMDSHTHPERLLADRRLPAAADASSSSGSAINRDTRPNIMDFPEHFEQIFKQLNSQRVHGQLCDCAIVVGGRHFKAHRAVLAACSTHFRALFSASEGDGSVSVIQLDSDVVTAEAFSVLMDMMYTSTLTLGDSDITDVLMAATHLHVNTVVKACKHYLNTQTLPRSPHAECPSQSVEQQLSNNTNSFPSQHLGLSIIGSALHIKSEDDGSGAGQEAGSVSGSGPEDKWCGVGEKQMFSLICSEAESSRDPSRAQGFEEDDEDGCCGGEEILNTDYERKGYRRTAAQEDVQLPSQSDSDRASSAEPLLLVVKEEYPDGDGVQAMTGAEDAEMKDGGRMYTKTFYGARPRAFLALIPENPQDSDAEISGDDDDDDDEEDEEEDDNDDKIEDPDYQPTKAEEPWDGSFVSMDDGAVASTSSSSKPPPCKKRRIGKNTLQTVSLAEPEDSPDPSPPSAPYKGSRRIWKYKDIETFQVPEASFEPPAALKTPFQYFKMLFTDKMIEHIAQHTNLYSAQKLGDPVKTRPEEIEDFLAILLFMGVFNLPSLEDYWHHASRFNMIADIMPKKRFKLLRRFIHFNDNQQCSYSPDRFYKIRPLFEMFREQCLLIQSTYKYSVDEVMVAYKGTRAGTLRQYIANKPDKWGFKLFCRAGSSGIIHDLLLYQGTSTFFNAGLSEQEHVLPLGAKLVTTLCKTIPQPWLSVVFCDNYFTSFNLIQNLHTNLGVKCIGTVRSNRLSGAPLMTDQELMKKGRGAFDYKSADGVIAVKWYDNKCINLLSNACGIMPLSVVQRWSREAHTKIAIPCPSLITAYDQHMRGIDLSDMLVHMYKTPAKSRRWYFPLFGYILDLSVTNSWLVYKRDCGLLNEKPMSLKMFRLAVAHSLKQVNKPASSIGLSSFPSPPRMLFQKKYHTPRSSRPQPDVRYDNCGHLPLHCDKRGRCNLCPKGVSRWKCRKCNVFLCLNANQQCFVAYHEK